MPQRTDLVVLSPRAWEKASGKYSTGNYRRLIHHEMTHIVEEYLSPDIESVPRWFSEGLAIYLSKQWKYEDDERVAVLEGMKKKRVPAISEMGDGAISNNAVRLSYIWGWTIVKYMDNMHGKVMLRKIVRQCDDGNISRLLDEDPQDFQQKWEEWLRKSHGEQ